MRQLAFLDRIFNWLFSNNRADWENKQDRYGYSLCGLVRGYGFGRAVPGGLS
jgi:hypothetical protein